MGSCCTSNERVEPVSQVDTQLDDRGKGKSSSPEFQGPVKNRGCTDVVFLLLMAVFVGGLIYLVFYCFQNGDVYRLINGYDKCGNICGRTNTDEKDPNSCKGGSKGDMTKRKFLSIQFASTDVVDLRRVRKDCVSNCNADRRLGNRCLEGDKPENINPTLPRTGVKDFLLETVEDLETCRMEFLYICLAAVGFAIIILLLFRFLVGIVVWLILIGAMLISLAGSIYLWAMWVVKREDVIVKTKDLDIENRSITSFLIFAIVATIATIIVWLVILVMRKRIKLVIQLFKESGKAINSMPFLLLQPFITFIALGCMVALWLYFTIWIESAGFFKAMKGDAKFAYYEKDTTIKVACWYNLFAMLWFAQFCIGCQHIVIAGAISKWFFTRNKDSLGLPIMKGFWNLVRYHLGSVALGSFIIALVQMVRVVLKFIEAQLKGRENIVLKCMFRSCQCCLWCFEKILQFLTRNAYIIIAMQGHNFCKSGKQAFKLLSSNALRVAAINSVGDFVLFMGKAIVVTMTVVIGSIILENIEGLHQRWVLLVLVGLFAYLVAHCFLTIYEMAIDTIFLCFCEDCDQNDGLSRPYFMSRGLMEFVQSSKKVIPGKGSSTAWSAAK